ncbi:MAG: two-component response regulator [Rhodospirillales bacterium]|nr:two-component response regulator [Rhodospirillales bacterium]
MNTLSIAPNIDQTQPGTPARAAIAAYLLDSESEGVVRQALSGRLDNPSDIRRGNIRKAIEALAQARSPLILIVDITGIELPISEIHRLAEVCEPAVHVIAVGDRAEIGLYRDLLQAGVSDYIVKPLTRELVRRAVDIATGTAAIHPISQKLGKLVTVLGTRGGIGATTIAVNLAWYLANVRARRVALLDLDLQGGDCAMMLESKPGPGLREALENPHRIDDRLLERTLIACGEHLFVLSAEEPLREELRFEPEAVQILIAALQTKFHYVIVDLPRAPSAIGQRAIDLAAIRIIVADETIRSAREIVRMRGLLGDASTERDNLLVVNRSGERRPGFIPHKDFAGAIEMQPIVEIPVQNLATGTPATYGKPAAAGRGKMAEAMASLAVEVSGRHAVKSGRRFWR